MLKSFHSIIKLLSSETHLKNKKNSLLWEISDRDTGSISYLFGTMHITDQRAFKHFDRITTIMSTCDLFATEIDLSESSNPKLISLMLLPPGKKLSNLLKPRELKRLDKIFKNLNGSSVEFYENVIPMQIMGMLSNLILGAENKDVLDIALYKTALKLEISNTGLESIEDHMNVLTTISIDEQKKMLKAVIKNFKSYTKLTKKMLELYIDGNVQKIYKIGRKNVGKFNKVLLLNRNIKMRDSFLQKSSESMLFAAVGAGHLGGKNGLLRLLKLSGKKVKPILLKG